jgi:hypothetical protein
MEPLEAMINRLLQHLRDERAKIELAIAKIRAAERGETYVVKKRGRKSMGAEERAEVSQRISNYWAKRRAWRDICVVVPADVEVSPDLEDVLLRAAIRAHMVDSTRRVFCLRRAVEANG